MNLHTSDDFNKTFTYPAVIDMLGRFNLEIELETVANLSIVPRDCHATVDKNRDSTPREDIVTNG